MIRATSDSGSFPDYPITRLSHSPIPPSVFPVILAGFTAFLDLYATQPLLPLLMRVFKTTHFAVSLTVTASTIGVAVAAPVVGRLADVIGRRRVIVGSAFVVTAATALAATSTNLTQFIGWRFVEGLATPGVFGIAIAYVHDEWPTSRVGRAMAAYVSGTVIGGFCGRALVGLVASSYDWHRAFAALAVANLVAATLLWFLLPGETRKASARSRDHGQSIARLIANPQLIGTNAVGFCVLFMQVAMFSYVTFHLSAEPVLVGHGGARMAVRRVSVWGWCDAVCGTLDRRARTSSRARVEYGDGSHRRALDARTVAARDCGRPRAGRHGCFRRAGDGEQLHRRRHARGPRAGGWLVLDLLLPGRKCRRRGSGIVLGRRWLARVRGARADRAGDDGHHCVAVVATDACSRNVVGP